ncbi:hypothetical protein [Nonlabens sp.]|uniref:hypothetical protein n=1 Tax=Nonlabens sp. TaxID=1888209 RepID=UPI003F69E117
MIHILVSKGMRPGFWFGLLFVAVMSLHAAPVCDGVSVNAPQDVIYGATVDIEIVNTSQKTVRWAIYGRDLEMIRNGNGSAMGEVVFAIPGTYHVIASIEEVPAVFKSLTS